MKQIDEILDNLARSIGAKIICDQFLDNEFQICFNPRVYFLEGLHVFGTGESEISTKLYLLYYLAKSHYRFVKEIDKLKEFKFNLEKLIFEPVEEELKPCIYCEETMDLRKNYIENVIAEDNISEKEQISEFAYNLSCENECGYETKWFESKYKAINAHNEIYRKVHGEE